MRFNPENERIKRHYFIYLKEAKHLSHSTLNGVARAVELFETHTKGQNFRRFHIQQAIDFKASLAERTSARTATRLSASSRHSILQALKFLFQWLAGQRGYKSRIATARRERPAPTIEQIQHVIISMPVATAIDRRNPALIAFTLLTGARVGALPLSGSSMLI